MDETNTINDAVAFAAYTAIQEGKWDAYLKLLRAAIMRREIELREGK